MPKGYHHLTKDQRSQLDALQSRGASTDRIATHLGVERSPLYRELKRNRDLKG
jgi:IS30 family transposase